MPLPHAPAGAGPEHRELWDAKHKSKLVKKGYLDGPADKAPTTQEFEVRYDCSCAMCAARFDTMAELIAHLGGEHDVGQINRVLSSGKGTVKCDRCRETFPTSSKARYFSLLRGGVLIIWFVWDCR